MNNQNDEEDNLKNENITSLRSYLTFDRMKKIRTNHVNDNFTFQNMPSNDTSITSFHSHRIAAIKSASHHISSTVELYSSVSAQLKSTFNQISSRQSISSIASSSSESNSSLPSSIVEIIVKSNEESLIKSAENLLRSKDSSINLDDEVVIKSTNQSLSTHENLFRCLSIADESLELNNLNLISSSSSLDSDSFENIYLLYPLNKRSNSVNKSKTIQELSFEDKEEDLQDKKDRSLNKKKLFEEGLKSLSKQKHHYHLKENYSIQKNSCLNCRVDLIELNLKNRKSLTVTIKWPLHSKSNKQNFFFKNSNQKDNSPEVNQLKNQKFSIQFKPTSEDQLLNVYISY